MFISYARSDASAYAIDLANALQEMSYACYFDGWAASFERKLPALVLANARRCSMLVVIGTKAAVENTNIADEVMAFVSSSSGKNRSLVVVKADPTIASASWWEYVERVAVPEQPHSVLASPAVLQQIEASVKFTTRARRLQRVAGMVLIGVAFIVAGAALWTQNAVRRASERVAEARRLEDEANRTRRLAEDARDRAQASEAKALSGFREAEAAKTRLETDLVETKTQKQLAEKDRDFAKSEAGAINESNVARDVLRLDPDAALRRAIRAVERSPAAIAVGVLREAIQGYVAHRAFGQGRHSGQGACATGDGSVVYTRGDYPNYPLRQWDVLAKTVRTIMCGAKKFEGVSCSPTDKHAVAFFGADRLAILRDVGASPEIVKRGSEYKRAEYAADGTGFMSSSKVSTIGWRASGQLVGERPFESTWGQPLLLPGAQSVIALGNDGFLRRIDLATGTVSKSNGRSREAVIKREEIGIRPPVTGPHVVVFDSTDYSSACELWDPARLTRLRTLDPCDQVFGANANQRLARTAGGIYWDGNIETGYDDFAFFPGPLGERRFLTFASPAGIKLWDVKLGVVRATIPSPIADRVDQTAGDGTFFTRDENRGFERWKPDQPLWTFDWGQRPSKPGELRCGIVKGVIARDGTRALVQRICSGGSTNESLETVSFGNKQRLTDILSATYTSRLVTLAMSPNGRWLAFDKTGVMQLVDASKSDLTQKALGTAGREGACLAANDRGEVAFRSDSGVYLTWDGAQSPVKVAERGCPIMFGPTSSLLYIADGAGKWLVQRLKTSDDKGDRTPAAAGKAKSATFEGQWIALSGDESVVVSLDPTGRLRKWSPASPKPSKEFDTLESVESIAREPLSVSTDGRFALVLYKQGLRVWDLELGTSVWSLKNTSSREIEAARFVSESTNIAYLTRTELRIEACKTCVPPGALVALGKSLLRPPKVVDVGRVDVCGD
ncbi:MAG TPA: TIR domain-containing protein [Polyangiaceae bacterium]|nr:TIR domain-containing protein [Polyangiaceae bacterium]